MACMFAIAKFCGSTLPPYLLCRLPALLLLPMEPPRLLLLRDSGLCEDVVIGRGAFREEARIEEEEEEAPTLATSDT